MKRRKDGKSKGGWCLAVWFGREKMKAQSDMLKVPVVKNLDREWGFRDEVAMNSRGSGEDEAGGLALWKIEDRDMVDCYDDGMLFLEAKVSGQRAQLLRGESDVKRLNNFGPSGMKCPLVLSVQINKFNCGGLAFLDGWPTVFRARMHEMIRPSFQAGTL
ncbi:hypothetical protein SADUNF_Sadunf17G0045900 [Salix dunnii]|uniref:Uncharacterized protein n=1 Tax=Salix dunnii TaxID=1413687 RepID=A0A835J9T1_9ROSI|nr:hypothetical protein SADUNF_Sadunf17G0045900 [Salix dunnii]